MRLYPVDGYPVDMDVDVNIEVEVGQERLRIALMHGSNFVYVEF